jgi:hypothetical protein
MLDDLRSAEHASDRLMAECDSVDECIHRAQERGFTRLALLKAGSQVGTSPMGARKGVLTVTRTVYDIESHRVVKGPDTATSQVIGWSDAELDWDAAAAKVMRELK